MPYLPCVYHVVQEALLLLSALLLLFCFDEPVISFMVFSDTN